MVNTLIILQVITGVLLTIGVLLQNTGSGIEGAIGGGGGSTDVVRVTRRGFERFVFQASIILGFAFGLLSLLIIVLNA